MKDFFLKNIHMIIIAYTALGLYDIYEQKMQQLEQEKQETPTLENKIRKAKRKLREINKFKQNLNVSKQRVREVVKQIEKVQKQLPTDVNDAEVQQLVGNIAKDLKIKNPSPSPGKEVLNGFYFAKDYKFSAEGTFLQFLIFFEKLAKAERILNVKKVRMAHIKQEIRSRFQVLNITAIVESFRYNKNYEEKVDVEAPAKKQ
jgi:Tfp pilus assembly protein PilO